MVVGHEPGDPRPHGVELGCGHDPFPRPAGHAGVDQLSGQGGRFPIVQPGEAGQLRRAEPGTPGDEPRAEAQAEAGGGGPGPARRSHVEHLGAADRLAPSGIPQHEPVARSEGEGDGETDPGEAARLVQGPEHGVVLTRSEVDLVPAPTEERRRVDRPVRR